MLPYRQIVIAGRSGYSIQGIYPSLLDYLFSSVNRTVVEAKSLTAFALDGKKTALPESFFDCAVWIERKEIDVDLVQCSACLGNFREHGREIAMQLRPDLVEGKANNICRLP